MGIVSFDGVAGSIHPIIAAQPGERRFEPIRLGMKWRSVSVSQTAVATLASTSNMGMPIIPDARPIFIRSRSPS
jgi:hypothetical protein